MEMWNIPALMHLGGEIKNTPVPVIIGAAPSHAGWIMSPSTWWDVIYDTMPVEYRDGNPITHTILRMYGFSQSTNRFLVQTGYALPQHAYTWIPMGGYPFLRPKWNENAR